MEERRISLCQKLWELDLPQQLTKNNLHLLFSPRKNTRRRYSSNSVSSINDDLDERLGFSLFECSVKSIMPNFDKYIFKKFAFQSVRNNIAGYSLFLKTLKKSFDVMCNSTNPLEKLCMKIFGLCHPEYDITDCNIHKSLFMTRILKHKLIRVKIPLLYSF